MSLDEILRNDKIQTIWVWMAAWLMHYVYSVVKWDKFRIYWAISNIVIAWWIGYLAWIVFPVGYPLRDVIISILWFCAYPLLNTIENYWPCLFKAVIETILFNIKNPKKW